MSDAAAGSENCLPVGTRLSDFEITGVLGEGGFGIVYLAFDHSLQRTVAIKEYMPGVLATRGADHSVAVRAERHRDTFNVGMKSFINEARFLAQFDHPSLVKVYRYWEQNQTAYTAMQYYDGRTIKEIVAARPELVTQAWCLSVMKQILAALEMLYTMNIVHRDVSPDNIIVQDNGDAVLLDFGSARQIIGDRTRGLTVILKPGYAPVEQYAGDASLEQGPYTDIYALAAVMYYAIVGEPPATSIARMVKDPIVPLRERALPGYSIEFMSALDHGLAVLAAQRPQTIDAFRALLGIAPSGTLRARTPGAAQRFSTVERMPPGSASALLAPERATTVELRVSPVLPVTPQPQRARPRWAAPVAAAAAVAGMALAAHALLGDPGDVLKPLGRTRAMPSAPLGTMPVPPLEVAPPASPATDLQQAGSPTQGEPQPSPSALGVQPSALSAVGVRQPVLPAFGAPPSAAPAQSVPPPQANALPGSQAGAQASTPAPAAVVAPPVKVREKAPASASYRLAIEPWGTVYVDGRERGVSPPLKKLALSAGRHKIRIVNPNFPDYVTEVKATANQPGTIGHDFSTPTN